LSIPGNTSRKARHGLAFHLFLMRSPVAYIFDSYRRRPLGDQNLATFGRDPGNRNAWERKS